MTMRQKKILMTCGAAACALGAAVVLAAGLLTPVAVSPGRALPADRAPRPATHAQADPSAPDAGVTLEELRALCAVDLRRPVAAAASAGQPATPSATALPLAVRLLGTADEPGHSMAIFQKGDGTIELVAQGEAVQDAGGAVKVTRIAGPKVTVEYAGQTCELTVPLPPAGGDANE